MPDYIYQVVITDYPGYWQQDSIVAVTTNQEVALQQLRQFLKNQPQPEKLARDLRQTPDLNQSLQIWRLPLNQLKPTPIRIHVNLLALLLETH